MVESVSLQTLLTYLTLISVPVGVFYHILTLRNQSRARQIQIIQSTRILGEDVWKLWQLDTSDTDAFIEDFFNPESNVRKTFLDYFNQLEILGAYLRGGLLDLSILANMAGGSIVQFFEKYEAIIHRQRAYFGGGSDKFLSEAEYLYHRLKDYVQEHPELKT